MNEEQTAELALGYLSRCEAGDLLIVDNAEVTGKKWRDLTEDPFYEKLRRLPMAVLMTTRHRDTGGRWLGRLEQEELREIFRRHEVQLSEGEMDALIDAVDGHTMTVDMIARTIRESWGVVSAEKILTAMKDNTLNEGDFDEIETDHDKEQRQIYAHLRALFDLSGIGENGRQALRCATLLPQNGMQDALFVSALPKAAATEIKLLEKKGWVDLKEGLVTIHPVVRLVCRTELKPTEENSKAFLRGIWGQYDRKQYEHTKFRQMAEVFENASEILEDQYGLWTSRAGSLWDVLGEPREALKCNLLSVKKKEKHRPGSANLATAYNNLGCTYDELGEHETALQYKLKSLEISGKILSPNSPEVAYAYNSTGYTYGNLGNYGKALEYELKALTIREKVLTTDHLDLATSYNNVGGTYGAMGDYEKELEYSLKALKIREKVLPPDHPNLALSYNNVGGTYGDLGDREKALEYQQKALMIWERVLPGNHPDLAMSYFNVAMDYRQLNKLAEAVAHMRRAADIINRSTLPESHPRRVKYNKWADQMELLARQSRGAD